MKPLDIVTLRPECQKDYRGILTKSDRFVYLGDINQMPGHGVFVLMGSGKVFTGFHTNSFKVESE